MNPSILLSADGTDCDNADEFASYVSFVADRIDERSALTVDVDSSPFGVAHETRITAANDAQRETIREALLSIWEEWCEQPAAAESHGTLTDYRTGEDIRPATAEEAAASTAAGERGVITVDGRSCYVS